MKDKSSYLKFLNCYELLLTAAGSQGIQGAFCFRSVSTCPDRIERSERACFPIGRFLEGSGKTDRVGGRNIEENCAEKFDGQIEGSLVDFQARTGIGEGNIHQRNSEACHKCSSFKKSFAHHGLHIGQMRLDKDGFASELRLPMSSIYILIQGSMNRLKI